jgi:hypothetical protein
MKGGFIAIIFHSAHKEDNRNQEEGRGFFPAPVISDPQYGLAISAIRTQAGSGHQAQSRYVARQNDSSFPRNHARIDISRIDQNNLISMYRG